MKNGSWIVMLRCTVIKEVHVFNCTEEQAAKEPFSYSDDERVIEQIDYEVLSVEPIKQ